VLYSLADAAAHTNEHILIVGGGDSAVEAALALAGQPGNHVTISYRKDAFTRLKPRNKERIETACREHRIEVVFNSQVQRIEPNHVVLSVEHHDGPPERMVRADYVYVLAGGDPPFALLKGLGIQFGGSSSSRSEVGPRPREARG
jgi:thioredoxin reductase (NADPH)